MIVEIAKASCSQITTISCYNKNYYELPMLVNGCNVLLEEFDECSEGYLRSIGTIRGESYQPVFWLHTDERGDASNYIFDSELLKNENEWS